MGKTAEWKSQRRMERWECDIIERSIALNKLC